MSGLQCQCVAAAWVKLKRFNALLLPCMSISDHDHGGKLRLLLVYSVPPIYATIESGILVDLVDYIRSPRSLIL